MKISGISTVFVFVENLDASREFYSSVLGLGKPSRDTSKLIEWKLGKEVTFAVQKAPLEVLEGAVPARSTVRFSFVVRDIKAAYKELFARNIRVLSEPQEGVGYLYVEFLDPDGNVLRLIQRVK